MKLKRDYYPEVGWTSRKLVLWEEDDAPVPDKETTEAALQPKEHPVTGLQSLGQSSLVGCWPSTFLTTKEHHA